MKIITRLLIITMLLGIIPCIYVPAETTEGISISCVEGDILVSGSFTAEEKAGETYNVYLATYEEDGTLLKVDKSEDLTVLSGTNAVSFTAPNVRNVQNTKAFVWTKSGINDLCEPAEKTIHTLKVFGIGNSFTVDAMEHLYNVAKDYGIDNIVLGYAYYGGCSLEKHWSYISENKNMYTYAKNTSGTWEKKNYQRINTMLADEDWNLIVLQQVSQYSGMTETFEPYLTNIIDYVNTNKTNEYAELAWQMTWAYQQNSSHSGFANYSKNQMTMYNAIVDANKYIAGIDEIDFTIPSGTAVQNARTSYLGDTLTRDGYHLSYNLGRYIASLTWFRKILGLPLDSIDWVPDSDEINSQAQKVAKESAVNAVNNPNEVTVSVHTEIETESEYVTLNYEVYPNSFYLSTVQAKPYNEITASSNANLNKYVSTKIFYKDELPNGTVLEIDSGYQYRPEGWTDLTVKNGTGTEASGILRPDNVTTERVVIDDAWWGDFKFRAFNISYEGNATVITDPAEVASHFRILIPSDAERLVELDCETVGGAYYNSSSASPSTPVTTASNSKYYVATEILEKSKIPNGSVIMIEPGFQYRPEGWIELTTKNSSSTRPANVTQVITVVDDAWWGSFNYRAFNIAYEGNSTNVTEKVSYVAARFHILVPAQ